MDMEPVGSYEVCFFTIDKKFIEIVHAVYETLSHQNMKFCVYFAHFCV
jgi:hypothetical protein